MRILYIDCFLEFDISMLLGALADADVDMPGIENEVKQLCPDAEIKLNSVKRCEIEALRADIIIPDSAENIKVNDVLSFTEKFTASCEHYPTLSRIAALCGKALSKSTAKSDINNAVLTNEICTAYAVLQALKDFNVEFIICSKGHCKDNISSQTIIPKNSICSQESFSLLWNKAFLSAAVNDYGTMPEMDILKIGYGAGAENTDTPNIIRAVLGEQHNIDTEHFYEFINTEFGVIP